MKIGEFSKRIGLSKDTIRYYEKIGLIQPAIQNKQREYTDIDIETIQTIIKLKDSGFSLKEIKDLFKWSKDADPNRVLSKEEIHNLLQIKGLFQEKYEVMLRKEERIKEMKEVLIKANEKMDYLMKNNLK